MINDTIYKIRHKESGLFSTGGMRPSFTKNGKIWKTLGHVKSHLRQLREPYYRNMYEARKVKYAECEIVTYHIIEDGDNGIPVKELEDQVVAAHDKRMKERQEKYDVWKKEIRLKEYEKLKEEFE